MFPTICDYIYCNLHFSLSEPAKKRPKLQGKTSVFHPVNALTCTDSITTEGLLVNSLDGNDNTKIQFFSLSPIWIL